MDPSHTRSSRKRSRPRDSPSPRRTPLVPEETGRPSRSSYTAQQTSLPSIRQLHPYLPPSSTMSQHVPGAGESSSYSYPPPQQQPGYAVGMHHESPQQQTTSDRSRGRGDSDAEGEGEPGPPKKKRRRQALSCTECKRRKIKCDRAQPCGPCSRRGEQTKCQWHIVEPIEKYVTRSEYDELKARFDTLEGTVNSLLRAGSTVGPASTGSVPMAPPYYQMNPMASAVPSYNPPPHPPQQQPGSLYGMMSSSPYMQPAPSRYPAPESPRTATSPRHMHPSMQQQPQQSPSSSPTIAHPHSPTRNPKSPTSATGPRHSPLSLASLTSPFSQLHSTHPPVPPSAEQAQSQSKNCHGAQMCERLRLADTARSHNNSNNTPLTSSSGGARWRAPRGAPWSITTRTRGGTAMRRWAAPGCSSSSSRATRTARLGTCTTSATRGWATCASDNLLVPAV